MRKTTAKPRPKPKRLGAPPRPLRRVPGARYTDLDAYFRATGDTGLRAARATGTSQCNISRVRHGHLVPRAKLAARIAKYAGIPIESFTLVYLRRHGASAARIARIA